MQAYSSTALRDVDNDNIDAGDEKWLVGVIYAPLFEKEKKNPLPLFKYFLLI